jgi:hypothetical protein
MSCYKCHGRGGFFGPNGWKRCACMIPTREALAHQRKMNTPKDGTYLTMDDMLNPTKNREMETMARSKTTIRKDHPDAWVAVKAGDTLTGIIVDITSAWSDVRGDKGAFYPLLTINVDEAPGYERGSELKLHCFGAVLFNEIKRHRPEVGETIEVTYLGTSSKAPKAGQNSPELYRVKCPDRKDQAGRAYAEIFGADTPTPAPQVVSDETAPDTEGLPF